MKTVLILVALVVAALITFNFITTGKVAVIPSSEPTGEAAVLKALADQLHDAFRAYDEAKRHEEESGFDSRADLRYITEEITTIERKLNDLKQNAKSMEVRGQAEKLMDEIVAHRMDVS